MDKLNILFTSAIVVVAVSLLVYLVVKYWKDKEKLTIITICLFLGLSSAWDKLEGAESADIIYVIRMIFGFSFLGLFAAFMFLRMLTERRSESNQINRKNPRR